jgi:DNA-directed RNA polymerase subunit alpha
LANPDQPLGRTGRKRPYKAEITISRGRGYLPASDRQASALGDIPVDAAFSPIRKLPIKLRQPGLAAAPITTN